jgi:hypothetical protein
MGDDADEFRILRHRMKDLQDDIHRLRRDSSGPPPVLVGQVFDGGSMPTTTPGNFAVHPVTLDGVEAEGEPGVFEVSSAKVIFLVLGSEVPEVGDKLIARLIDGRWVARKDGGAACTMDLLFRHSSAFTNVNGSGEATITVSPAIGGVTTFQVVPVHHPAAGGLAEYWDLTIEDIHVDDGTYTFTMSRTGTGTQTFVKTVIDCVASHGFTCLCATLPDEVFLTSVGTADPSGYLRDCTLVYGPLSSDYFPYTTAAGYGPTWHTPDFTHPTTGEIYMLALYCKSPTEPNPAIWFIHNFVVPQNHIASAIWYWDWADPANTCDPPSWTAGSYMGSAPGVDYTLT